MNIKLIGTGSIYTKYNSACTMINDEIIVDMPNGTLKQLLKQSYDVTKIHTILITHMHGDHIADLPFFFKYVFNYLKSQRKIVLVGPIGIKKKVIELFNAYNFENKQQITELFSIEFREVLEEEMLIFNDKIQSFLVSHGEEKPALGYVINKTIGFTGDSGLCSGIEAIFQNSKIVVSDTSFMIGDHTHLGFDNLTYLYNKYQTKIVATHLRDNTREELLHMKVDLIQVEDDFYEFNI